MSKEAILILAEGLKEYYGETELRELCDLYDIPLESEFFGIDVRRIDPLGISPLKTNYLKFARRLIIEIEMGNNRRFLETLVPSLISRSQEHIAKTEYQKREYHQTVYSRISQLKPLTDTRKLPEEISIPEDHPFTAKSEIREFIEPAQTQITIVDPYVGVGTLDCIRGVKQSIRILTGERAESIQQGFDTALKDFRGEGYLIEIRLHPKLHDRYIIFNERCWLVGSSLKDAGKKTLNIIECVDSKTAMLEEVERKWKEGRIYQSATSPIP